MKMKVKLNWLLKLVIRTPCSLVCWRNNCVLNALSRFTIIMAKLDLLQGDFTNPIFAVTFDFYSPRPHFMILLCYVMLCYLEFNYTFSHKQ